MNCPKCGVELREDPIEHRGMVIGRALSCPCGYKATKPIEHRSRELPKGQGRLD